MNKRIEDTAYRPGGLAQPAQQSPHPEYDRGFSNGWDKCAEQQALAQPEQKPVVTQLLNRLEHQWHRMGELWERCQGKGWPSAESDEFTALRDEKTPANRAALLAIYTSPPQRQPLTEEKQIAEDLRFHGLQLVKTATGYAVLKLGQVAAHGIGDKT